MGTVTLPVKVVNKEYLKWKDEDEEDKEGLVRIEDEGKTDKYKYTFDWRDVIGETRSMRKRNVVWVEFVVVDVLSVDVLIG
ncbi:MAG: hypothetical protein ACK53Y_07305, partial [bacterium]